MATPRTAWRTLTAGLRVLLRRDNADADVADELAHFATEAEAALIADGVSPDEARRRVRREYGDDTRVREQMRDAGWEESLALAVRDVGYAVRRLRRDASFTVVICATLALGIGATTAIFSAVNPVLFRPLPYPDANRLLAIADRSAAGAPLDVTFGTYRELASRARTVEAFAVFKPWQPTLLTGGSEPERLDGQRVSVAYFQALGVRPAIGREFLDEEDRPRGGAVVIISHGLWTRRFAGDPAVVGRQVRFDGYPFTVIGVMPAGFRVVQAPTAEAWAPLQYDPALPPDGREWGHHLRMIARLRRGVALAAAQRDIEEIATHPVIEFRRMPWAGLAQGLVVTPLQEEVVRAVRPALIAIAGAVLLVLLAACVNATSLLLARGAQRRGELAMRTALGAGRWRLIRQLVTESVVLACAGGAAGVVVAAAGVQALVVMAPAALPRVDAIRFDGAALAFAIAVSALVGIVIGALPAWQATRRDPHDGLQHAPRTVAGHRGARSVLVVAEVAVALVLLVVAGLLVRSLQQLFAVDTGFSSSHVLTLQVSAADRGADPVATRQFFERALAAVQVVPGAEAAGWTSQLPLSGDFDKYGAQVEANVAMDATADASALRYAVTPRYFDAMGIHLRRGRLLDDRDRAVAPVAVVVSESFVKHRLPGLEPIGQRLHLGRTDLPWYTIVGVVGDVRQASLATEGADAVYITTEQWFFADSVLSLAVRSSGDAASLAPAVRRAIWSVDPSEPIVRVSTLGALVAASAAERRFAAVILECFALVALVLAATGIYGVLSGAVTERLREMGVRAALGASRADLLALVFGQGMALAAIGVVLGAIGAVWAGHAITAMLFGISPLDTTTYVMVTVLLTIASAAACWAPAWRASRVDPVAMLRAD